MKSGIAQLTKTIDGVAVSACKAKVLIPHIEITDTGIMLYSDNQYKETVWGLIDAFNAHHKLQAVNDNRPYFTPQLSGTRPTFVTFKENNKPVNVSKEHVNEFLSFIIKFQSDKALRHQYRPLRQAVTTALGYYIKQMSTFFLKPYDETTPLITKTMYEKAKKAWKNRIANQEEKSESPKNTYEFLSSALNRNVTFTHDNDGQGLLDQPDFSCRVLQDTIKESNSINNYRNSFGSFNSVVLVAIGIFCAKKFFGIQNQAPQQQNRIPGLHQHAE